MKNKIVIKTNILKALIYFLGALGIIPGLLMAGYALIVQKDEECKTPSFITIGVSAVLAFIKAFIFAPILLYSDIYSSTYTTVSEISFWLSMVIALFLVILGILALCGVNINIQGKKSQQDKFVEINDSKPEHSKNKISDDMGPSERETAEVEQINEETDPDE